MGPYCEYCDHRCFVPRQIRDADDVVVWDGLMATCAAGIANDRKKLNGWDFRNSYNPWDPANVA